MKINNVSITKTAQDETDNGKYYFEYIIADGVLIRVHASISKLNEKGENIHVGTITYDHNLINCSLPQDAPKSAYFEDFDAFMVRIKADAKQYENETEVKTESLK